MSAREKCPGCGQRVVVPGGGVEAHICAPPERIKAFFEWLDGREPDGRLPALLESGDEARAIETSSGHRIALDVFPADGEP